MHSFLYDVYAYFIFFPKISRWKINIVSHCKFQKKKYARQKKLPGFV